MGKNKSKTKIEISSSKVTEKQKDEKISFSFKYFKNLDEKTIRDNVPFLKEMLERIKILSQMTIFEAIILHKILVLEKSAKTKTISKQIINDDNFFKKCDNNIYDLFRGDKILRIFGILDSQNSCFYILMFDPTHKSR